jgi:copper chaperone for superoxide dismutase
MTLAQLILFSVGDHFNPRSTRHGSPVDGENDRHVGDLGNVVAGADGRATFKLSDRLVKVSDIIGRSLVVAAGRDDLGRGDSPLSKVGTIGFKF